MRIIDAKEVRSTVELTARVQPVRRVGAEQPAPRMFNVALRRLLRQPKLGLVPAQALGLGGLDLDEDDAASSKPTVILPTAGGLTMNTSIGASEELLTAWTG